MKLDYICTPKQNSSSFFTGQSGLKIQKKNLKKTEKNFEE